MEHARLNPRRLEYLRRVAIRARSNHRLSVLGRLHVSRRGKSLAGIVQTLIREKEEELVFEDRAADAPAEVAESVLDPLVGRATGAAVLVESVQSGLIVLEEEAAVVNVGPVLRYDLDLRPRIAAVLGIVGVSADFDLLHRLLVRRDYGSAPKTEAVDADPIDQEVVVRHPLAGGGNRDHVLRLKNGRVGAAGPAGVRQVSGIAVAGSCAIAENALRQAQQFVGISPVLR